MFKTLFGCLRIRVFTCLTMLICPVVWIHSVSAQTVPETDLRTTDTLALSPEEKTYWLDLFNRFSLITTLDDPTAQRALLDEFMGVDQDTIPPGLRHAYYSTRLFWDHTVRLEWDTMAHWEDILAIRDRLMRDRSGLRDSLVDADLLYIIASYFSNNVVAPPTGTPLPSDRLEAVKVKSAYWKEHYKDDLETERIYRYIVENFDPDYAVVPRALALLGFTESLREKSDDALSTYKAFMNTDINKVFSVPRYDFTVRLISAEEQLEKEKADLQASLDHTPISMAIVASDLVSAETALAQLESLKQKYPDNEKAQQEINYGLISVTQRMLSARRAQVGKTDGWETDMRNELFALRDRYPNDTDLNEAILQRIAQHMGTPAR